MSMIPNRENIQEKIQITPAYLPPHLRDECEKTVGTGCEIMESFLNGKVEPGDKDVPKTLTFNIGMNNEKASIEIGITDMPVEHRTLLISKLMRFVEEENKILKYGYKESK